MNINTGVSLYNNCYISNQQQNLKNNQSVSVLQKTHEKHSGIAFHGNWFSKIFNPDNKQIVPVVCDKKINDGVTSSVPISFTDEDKQKIHDDIEKGIKYEQSTDYNNLDIFKNVDEQSKKRMLAYFKVTHKEADLLSFATGNRIALLEGIQYFNDDVFDALRSDDVSVCEFFSKEKGNLIVNNKLLNKFIIENKDFLQKRFELSNDCSVKDIEKLITSTSFGKLGDKKKYADILALLTGHSKNDAYISQIIQDIRKELPASKDFYGDVRTNELEEYKQALKKSLLSETSSYKNMDATFKNNLLNTIDSVKSFNNFPLGEDYVYIDDVDKKDKLNDSYKLSQKLNKVRQTGEDIKLNSSVFIC